MAALIESESPAQPQPVATAKLWPYYLLIGILALLVWGQTVTYEFVWDDQVLIVKNQSIRSLRNLPAMLNSLEAQDALQDVPSFRPLRTAWYAMLTAIGGTGEPRPWLFHLSNVLWHAGASMLLFSVALALLESLPGAPDSAKRIAALLVAAGFSLHPVNSEPVSWVKCLDDLMAAVFVFAATRSLLKWKNGLASYLAALGYFVLAMYAKESTVPFAAVAFFIAWGFRQMPWRNAVRAAVPFFIAAFLYMLHRHVVIGRTSQCPPLAGDYGTTLINMLPVAGAYLRLAFGIPPFCIDYSYMVSEPPHRFLSGPALGGLALLVAATATAIWLWFNPRWRVAAFGLIWAGLFLLPVSNLVPMMQYMGERFLYVPLPGLLIAAAAVLLQLPKPRLCAISSACCVVIWCAASCNRMTIWRDELTLYVQTSLEHPGIKRVEDNAVLAIFRLPWMNQLFPDLKTKNIRMAGSLTRQQAEPMINVLTQAHTLFSTNELIASALAFAYGKSGQWSQAVSVADTNARQHPDSVNQWFNLAAILRASGGLAKALEACDKALAINPRYVQALRLRLSLCDELKDYPSALACARKLEAIDPKNPEIPQLIRELQEKAGPPHQ